MTLTGHSVGGGKKLILRGGQTIINRVRKFLGHAKVQRSLVALNDAIAVWNKETVKNMHND